jgi:hypothetical protein
MEQFLHWPQFVKEGATPPGCMARVHSSICSCTYLHKAGLLVFIETKGLQVLRLDPNWLCKEIIGSIFLTETRKAIMRVYLERKWIKLDGLFQFAEFKSFFRLIRAESSDAKANDVISMLLWLRLCSRGRRKVQGKETIYSCCLSLLKMGDQEVLGVCYLTIIG